MTKKNMILSISLLLFGIGSYGQNYVEKSRVYLSEKQNKTASAIPALLLEAYSKGDIKAFYPKDSKREVIYSKFLNNFWSTIKANQAIGNDYPSWFCADKEVIVPDNFLIKCMQYNFEIGEQEFRNNITYQQEKKLVYVKVIYSGECSANGLEKEGPIFLIKDIKRLKSTGKYKLTSPENQAFSYSIMDYLNLRLFRAVPKKN